MNKIPIVVQKIRCNRRLSDNMTPMARRDPERPEKKFKSISIHRSVLSRLEEMVSIGTHTERLEVLLRAWEATPRERQYEFISSNRKEAGA